MVTFMEVLIIFGIILAICWIILPFAILGTKPLLRELVAEMKRNNELLDQRLPALRRPETASTRPSALDPLEGFATKPPR